jgi:hypothetical protein
MAQSGRVVVVSVSGLCSRARVDTRTVFVQVWCALVVVVVVGADHANW